MNNPYYVRPMGGVDISDSIMQGMRMREMKDRRDAQDAQSEQEAQFARERDIAMASTDPVVRREFFMKYPERTKAARETAQFYNDQSKEVYGRAAAALAKNPENWQAITRAARKQLVELGAPVNNLEMDIARYAEMTPEQIRAEAGDAVLMTLGPEMHMKLFDEVGGTDAGSRERAYMEAHLSGDDFKEYLQYKAGLKGRPGNPQVVEFGKGKYIFDPSDRSFTQATVDDKGNVVEMTPEKAAEGEATVAAALTTAKGEAGQKVKDVATLKKNASTLRLWDQGLSNYAKALGATTTGPGMAMLPAITGSAQMAEGAYAAMAPILKSLFREAGEGTFTKDDQQILLDMLPDRDTHPEVAKMQMEMLDKMVRIKLGGGTISPATDASPVPDGVDAAIWAEMTPEERALWQQ